VDETAGRSAEGRTLTRAFAALLVLVARYVYVRASLALT
jgi:hypothetical protein